MADIENIANKHLGRASDGTIVKPYETPTHIDPSLLVAVPRILNRTQYGIDENNLPFVGYDVWHCYEFSTLLDNGAPVTGLLKIVYPSNTPNIVESKSLKLYLNSFNMDRLGRNIQNVIINIEKQIMIDLSDCIESPVNACLHIHNGNPDNNTKFFDFINIDPLVKRLNISKYNEDPSILTKVDCIDQPFQLNVRSSLLRSNCRVTNQPDWGDVFIHIAGKNMVSEESLLEYIISLRNENHFHEEICECIFKRLYDLLNPSGLFVACLYTRRGGIDINPIRALSLSDLNYYSGKLANSLYLTPKTLRQ